MMNKLMKLLLPFVLFSGNLAASDDIKQTKISFIFFREIQRKGICIFLIFFFAKADRT